MFYQLHNIRCALNFVWNKICTGEMYSVTIPTTVSHIQPTRPSIFSHSSSHAHSLLSLFNTNIRIRSLTRSNSPYLHTFIYPHSVSCNFSFTPIFKLHSGDLKNKPQIFCCPPPQKKKLLWHFNPNDRTVSHPGWHTLIHIRQQRYGPDIFITDALRLGIVPYANNALILHTHFFYSLGLIFNFI